VTTAQRSHLTLGTALREYRGGLRQEDALEKALQDMVRHNLLSAVFTWKSVPLLMRCEQAVRHNPLPYNVDEEDVDVDMHEFYTTKKRRSI
jgi:hypothetical protein